MSHPALKKRYGGSHAIDCECPGYAGNYFQLGLEGFPFVPPGMHYPEQPGAGGFGYNSPPGPGHDPFFADMPVAGGDVVKEIARYYEGGLFFPGTPAFVYEPVFERTALQAIWGQGFEYPANQFKVSQPPQVWSHPNVVTNGLGGLMAGQFALQGLEQIDDESIIP